MTHPKDLNIADFNYELPNERIAKFPLAQRDKSKLLVSQGAAIKEATFQDIASYLPCNSLLIFNNTKVIQARLLFKKETGAAIEIFCLEPVTPADHAQAFSSFQENSWLCMVKNLKKWKAGDLQLNFSFEGKTYQFKASYIKSQGKEHIIQFHWDAACTFAQILEQCGVIPIPPYLYRESQDSDKESYQTVYAKHKGSVAAPTAGLHFTDTTFSKLKKRGIQTAELTLHVGAGTFQPVKATYVGGHTMHSEQVLASASLIEKIKQHNDPIISVGTTSTRSLESLYWLGCVLAQKPHISPQQLQIAQWIAYDNEVPELSKTESMEVLQAYMKENDLQQLHFSTEIIIAPGYTFRIISGLITNFHQPQSTLLLLISAFLKEINWREIYSYAMQNNFRFLSYGDSCLLLT